ncbi:unnamed protein product [Scytosiphon promiscuus]
MPSNGSWKWVVTTAAMGTATGVTAVALAVVAVVGTVVVVADALSNPEPVAAGFSDSEPVPVADSEPVPVASSEPVTVAVPVAVRTAASPKRTRMAASPKRTRMAASPKRTPSPVRKDIRKDEVSHDGYISDDYATDGYATDVTAGGYGTSGYNTVASDEADAKKRSIVVRNGSSRTVSFFVLDEANMRTKAIKAKIKKQIASYLKCFTAGAGAALSGKGLAEIRIVKKNDPTFLLHDHKVRPSRCPGSEDHVEIGTTIKYPRRCRNLRVLAYFKDDKGEWKRYKNKVYSVGRRKTSHTITAMDHQIEGHL